MAETASRVSVIIPNWNGERWLEACLRSLHAQDRRPLEIILVDNGSSDRSLELARRHAPDATIIELGVNTGFAVAANRGVEAAAGRYVFLLNTDTQVAADCIRKLEDAIETCPENLIAVMPLMVSLDAPDRVDDAGDRLSWYGQAVKTGHGEPVADFDREREIFSPCGGAVLLRRADFLALGGFDAGFFAYLEDVDFGLRARLAGYRHRLLPAARVLHKGHGSAMPQRRYLVLTTRNRLALMVRNLPAGHLLRNAHRIAYGTLQFAFDHGQPMATLQGLMLFCRDLPGMLAGRGERLARIRLSAAEIEGLLSREQPAPGLLAIAARRLRRAYEVIFGRRP
ncbi:MAG: glycosyltransferase family 2 protein [Nitratireductor sp.]|nr:glycosyltransferase family 2 protein [Nitratireductor sp.]